MPTGALFTNRTTIMKNTEQRIGKIIAAMAPVGDGEGREVASGM